MAPETRPVVAEMCNTYIGFPLKVAIAAASGYCCALFWESSEGGLLYWGLPGLLFAAGVLFPYLRRDRRWWYRSVGLVVMSAISYYSAMTFGLSVGEGSDFGPAPEGFVAASLLGAAIVLVGARLLIPLKNSVGLVVAGLAAAVIGGFGFVLAWEAGEQWLSLGFMLWHSLMAAAIHTAENCSLPFGRTK